MQPNKLINSTFQVFAKALEEFTTQTEGFKLSYHELNSDMSGGIFSAIFQTDQDKYTESEYEVFFDSETVSGLSKKLKEFLNDKSRHFSDVNHSRYNSTEKHHPNNDYWLWEIATTSSDEVDYLLMVTEMDFSYQITLISRGL